MHDCAAVWRCMLLGMIVIGAQKILQRAKVCYKNIELYDYARHLS